MKLDKILEKGQGFLNARINKIQQNIDNPLILTTASDYPDIDVYQDNHEHIVIEDDDIAKDLIILVGTAIDQWAKKHKMENIPKKIIFNQALTILNGIEQLWPDN